VAGEREGIVLYSSPIRSLAWAVATTAAILSFGLACGHDDDAEPNGSPTQTGASATPEESGQPTDGTDVPNAPVVLDAGLQIEEIPNLEQPTQIVFLDDNDLLVAQKSGAIVRVTDGAVVGPVAELKANFADERGVLGLVLHPDFASNNYVYVYWTWTGEGEAPEGLFGEATDDLEAVPENGNRIDRFTWDGSALRFDRNIIELPSRTTDLTIDRRRGNHDGGVINFGPDGKLYAVMGDENARGYLANVVEGPSPEETGLLGVVLRLNDDGSVPADNPFVSLGDPMDKVYLYGLRNSFGHTFDPKTGAFWLEMNGQASMDTIGTYPPGANLGWIQLMGPPTEEAYQAYVELESASERLLDAVEFPPSMLAPTLDEAMGRLVLLGDAQYVPPLIAWKYATAPAAIGFVDGTALGADYDGVLLAGDVNSGNIYMFTLNDDRSDLVLEGGLADRLNDNSKEDLVGELSGHVFAQNILVATDIEQAPDGSLWISSNVLGALYRISAVD
jgi:glucose/arabinose dehydrogenase